MIIANPIYDVVFKYLLEDIEIARELLSIILGEDIVSVELKPQETATESPASSVHILRFDFKAVIKTQTGDLKKVLIELQKAKQGFDVMRFRRYLGDNYKKEDDVFTNKTEVEKRPLPIVTMNNSGCCPLLSAILMLGLGTSACREFAYIHSSPSGAPVYAMAL